LVIFLADGGLGNQIFQYVFIRTIAKNDEKIIVSGFEDLLDVFNIHDIVNFNKDNRWIRAFVYRVCKPILIFLSRKKIISSIEVNHEEVLDCYTRESATYKLTLGLVKNITFLKLGFFQSKKFFDEAIADQLELKKKYLDNADELLKGIPKKCYRVIVHIRRGDYENYTVYGQSTLLPLSYFKKQVEWFSRNKKNCFFIFLSDRPEFIEEEFGYVEKKFISGNNHFGTDFAIMTQCKSAILSPSSFGWWGSYMMKERDIIFAPKYWLGFSSKIEYHEQGVPDYSKAIEV